MNNNIDAKILKNMIISGAHNLKNHRNEVDELNVYPVPDGDTGTNMSLTIMNVADELKKISEPTYSEIMTTLASGSLRGARGNSGVILSQLARGFSKVIKENNNCNIKTIALAFEGGAKTAYKAVMKPTEGTILTVARELGRFAMKICDEEQPLIDYAKRVLEHGNEALASTEEMLPALKSAGVVDAGGKGLMVFLEGAFYTLETGKIIECDESVPAGESTIQKQGMMSPEDVKFSYCTEFIIIKNKTSAESKSFKKSLEHIGDCVLVIDDGEIVKVHVHTNDPGVAIQNALKLGPLTKIKIDNLKEQVETHTIIEEKKVESNEKPVFTEPQKEFGFVAVSIGEGIDSIFTELGIDYLISGGQTMNPSTDDFLKAFDMVNSNNIFVFPNNKNIILAAKQAAENSSKNILVVETTSICHAVSCMLNLDPDKKIDEIKSNMDAIIKKMKTASVTFAARDSETNGMEIKTNDILGISGKEIKFIGKDVEKVCIDSVSDIVNEDTSVITLFYGSDVTDEDAEKLNAKLTKEYPDCDVLIYNGGQPLYYYFMSAE